MQGEGPPQGQYVAVRGYSLHPYTYLHMQVGTPTRSLKGLPGNGRPTGAVVQSNGEESQSKTAGGRSWGRVFDSCFPSPSPAPPQAPSAEAPKSQE